jgi:DNA-binding PadR family transcriptional regulator
LDTALPHGGSSVIDVDVYLEIADLFRFRWDPAILGVLAERPHRFRELGKRLETHIDDHLDDNALDRGLKRLTRHKYIIKARTRIGRRDVPIYTITPEGRLHLRIYAAFIDTYQRVNMPKDNPTTNRRHAS